MRQILQPRLIPQLHTLLRNPNLIRHLPTPLQNLRIQPNVLHLLPLNLLHALPQRLNLHLRVKLPEQLIPVTDHLPSMPPELPHLHKHLDLLHQLLPILPTALPVIPGSLCVDLLEGGDQ